MSFKSGTLTGPTDIINVLATGAKMGGKDMSSYYNEIEDARMNLAFNKHDETRVRITPMEF